MNTKDIRILLVEDDQSLGAILSEYLIAKGYQCDWMDDGKKGWQAFNDFHYDFIVLDIMMPHKDGFTLAAEIRKSDPGIPILFLTAKSMKEDTLRAFQIGADDYMTKPFSMEELIARMTAILRRTGKNELNEGPIFKIGEFEFNSDTQTLRGPKSEHKLTTKESEVLYMLVTSKGVLDKSYALKVIWGDDSYFTGRSMDVYLSRLRKYLKEDESVEIVNLHGKGFKLINH